MVNHCYRWSQGLFFHQLKRLLFLIFFKFSSALGNVKSAKTGIPPAILTIFTTSKTVKGEKIISMGSGKTFEALETGIFSPTLKEMQKLSLGEVGYIATGLKNLSDCRVGETITLKDDPSLQPLKGYESAKPMVYSGLYPTDGDEYPFLRDALGKLQLNDASFVFEPESSGALGFGFRCGFLGLLHMDIIQERLEREYDIDLIVTAPTVKYTVETLSGSKVEVLSLIHI